MCIPSPPLSLISLTGRTIQKRHNHPEHTSKWSLSPIYSEFHLFLKPVHSLPLHRPCLISIHWLSYGSFLLPSQPTFLVPFHLSGSLLPKWTFYIENESISWVAFACKIKQKTPLRMAVRRFLNSLKKSSGMGGYRMLDLVIYHIKDLGPLHLSTLPSSACWLLSSSLSPPGPKIAAVVLSNKFSHIVQ